jgi:hypothetical protein
MAVITALLVVLTDNNGQLKRRFASGTILSRAVRYLLPSVRGVTVTRIRNDAGLLPVGAGRGFAATEWSL